MFRIVFGRVSLTLACSLSVLALAASGSAYAQAYPDRFDRREASPKIRLRANLAARMAAQNALRRRLPNAIVSGGQDMLTPFSILASSGALATVPGRSAAQAGMTFLQDNVGLFGLTRADLSLELTDRVVTKQTGAVHEYYRQTHPKTDLPIFYSQAQFHTQQGRLLLTNVGLTAVASALVNTEPAITAAQALDAVAEFFGLVTGTAVVLDQTVAGFRRSAKVGAGFLEGTVTAEFGLIAIGPNELEPVWLIRDAWFTDGPLYDLTVSAQASTFAAGPADRVVTAFNNHKDGSYRVYSAPVESPIHTSPLPPSDARVVVTNPEDAVSSPNGWFDAGTTLMDGNNVRACADRNGNNACDSGQPSCPGQVCDFPIDLTADPSAYTDASIANLFYWNNVIHDVQYQYGFDEAGGNFQENNFGNGGNGSDSVNAEAQDNANGSSRCNANFATPSDGNNPRMQMFVCDDTNPQRDGSLDNGVIIHEYGHGISTRQVGGPSTSCLNNRQQAGEGWSDWHGLVYTAVAQDQGTDVRGIGAYLFGLPADGTIRPQQYSTDPAVNSYTYASINGLSIPHGVGSVWSQAMWELYWALVDKHGFEADLLDFDINDPNEAGNKRALFYVNEGLKNTSCSPTFVANRNGIIAAAESAFGGEDVCDLWEAFAAFGLGTNAVSGGSNSTAPTNGFDLPTECAGPPPPSAECPDGSAPLYATDFETTGHGWSQGNDSCATGSFVRGSPTEVVNGGVTTQVAGGADGSSNAFFTAPNSAAGTNDVDGGTCEALSPVVDASSETAVDVFVSYFHGQRDAGDDAADGFSLQVLNNGSVVDTPVAIGDVTVNATWTAVVTTVASPGSIQLRARATDGTGDGDLIEAGVDSVLICASSSNPPPPPPPPTCAAEVDFESGAAGWVNDGASTCTTGSYVVGTPTEQTNSGVTTQVGGANSGANALFTATNTSAGANDVDGGNCIARSPTYTVSEASTLSVSYFHGQRDAGDDASGDFFRLEVSTDGGSTFATVVSNGDAQSNAAWSTATAAIPAGSDVVVRVQCSDGAGPGDLVECGIDDLSICPQ